MPSALPFHLGLLVCGVLPRPGRTEPPLVAWGWGENLPFPGRGARGGQVSVWPRRHQTPPVALDWALLDRLGPAWPVPAGSRGFRGLAQRGTVGPPSPTVKGTTCLWVQASSGCPSGRDPGTEPSGHRDPGWVHQLLWGYAGQTPLTWPGARAPRPSHTTTGSAASREHQRPPRVGPKFARGQVAGSLRGAESCPLCAQGPLRSCTDPVPAGHLPSPAGPRPLLGQLPQLGLSSLNLVSVSLL